MVEVASQLKENIRLVASQEFSSDYNQIGIKFPDLAYMSEVTKEDLKKILRTNFRTDYPLVVSESPLISSIYINSPVLVEERGEALITKGTCPRCDADITVDQLKQVYTKAREEHLVELAETFNKYKKIFKLDTCARKAHFFAQSIQEAGLDLNGALHGEKLNYSAEALPVQFKKFRRRNSQGQAVDKYGNPTTEEARIAPNDLALQYGRSHLNNYVANEKKIAEIAYGDRGGNLSPEDAWNFRGRGLLQITFRKTYKEIQNIIDQLTPDSGVRISEGKDIDYTIKEATLTGMADWYKDKMFLKADATGREEDNKVVDSITEIINSNTKSYAERKGNFRGTKPVFFVDQCLTIKVKIRSKDKQRLKYDIEKAIDHLNKNSLSQSKGKCALYVRQAINAGGIYNLSGHAREYYDTDKLVSVGFKKIGNDIDSIQLKKGDIAAFAAVKGHSYGHIAMYNGTDWISDFKQKSFWVARQYSIEKRYSIYRWE